MTSVGTPAAWIGFGVLVGVLRIVDLAAHRRDHRVRPREALVWTAIWIGLALAFDLVVYLAFGAQPALEFLTGYLIEKALSVDNLFVFLVLFAYFAVPAELQHRVLFWGILGAMIMRAGFILAGAALLQRFGWLIHGFGALLVFTAIKLFVHRDDETPPPNRLLHLFQRILPTVSDYRSGRLTVIHEGRRHATPLLLALLTVEASDILFAIDSVPAIFGVTRDPFIVYTSNIFAILGLRSLYFVLAGALERFRYLKTGLALVLGFIGAKMILAAVWHVPVAVSLAVVAALLGGTVLASLRHPRPAHQAP